MTPFIRRILNRLPASLFRLGINLWLPFLGAGIKIKKIAPDFRYVETILKFRWYNRNYLGTQFGGSIYAMTDAFFVIMLIKNLGNDYIIWDKAAKIDYLKPGKSTLTAIFKISEAELTSIKSKTDELGKYVFDQPIEVIDEVGEIIASVIKTIYVRKKSFVAS